MSLVLKSIHIRDVSLLFDWKKDHLYPDTIQEKIKLIIYLNAIGTNRENK